ncbi:MAG: helix-turn-helix transcriptional regulator [Thermodesulfobacteriota bacterium]
MAGNKSQLARLLFIDQQIREGMRSGRLANCTSLSGEYEVSAKTILRDIEFLRVSHDAPIEYDQQRKGYYYAEENYALPALHIREGDLFSLLVAQKGLEQYRDTPLFDALSSVFKKIEQSLPDKVSVDSAWLGNRISVLPEQHTVIAPAIWETVARALQHNQVLRLDYQRPGAANPASRQVEPYHLTRHQGEWYLIGFCHLRAEVRTFAVSRIGRAEETGQSFVMPEQFDYQTSMRDSFGIFRGERQYQVRLRFEARQAPFMLERIWHREQRVQRHRDGSATLTLPATDLVEIRRWILSWGAGVKVLAPRELAEAVRQELSQALAVYPREQGS